MCSFIKGIDKLFGYSATKFAIRALTQSAGTQLCGGFFSRAATDPTLDGSARELGKYGITVNAYAPGGVETQLRQ